MGADHDRLDALRRLAKDRAATPAEKVTARRFAKALADKIGKRPRRGRRKGGAAALPEPPAARWRRLWIAWLEAALHKIAVAGKWLHVVWFVSVIGLVLMFVFGSKAVRNQAGDVYLVRTLGLLAVAFAMIAVAGLLALAAWWLKTWRGERLRPALILLAKDVMPWLAATAGTGLFVYLEYRFKWPTLLGDATNMAVMFAICIPSWRWVCPAIERVLLRASHSALRTGVIVLAIAVTVLAGGAWAYVYAR
jgi:hypothetical protein